MFNDLKAATEAVVLTHELGIDIEERIVYLFGELGGEDDHGAAAIQNIRFLTSAKRFSETYKEPIRLVIDSPGGSDVTMLHLYDTILASPAPIWTIGCGEVCSASTLILVAGAKRFAHANCFFMTHKGKVVIDGDEDEVAAQAALHKRISDRYWRLMERHTKLSSSEWFAKSKQKGELWLGVEKMLEYGVIDERIEPMQTWPPLSVKPLRSKKNEDEDSGDE